jgi:carboxyl-terminal processing protease
VEQLELKKTKSWVDWSITLNAPQAVGTAVVLLGVAFWFGTTTAGGSLFASAPVYDPRAPEKVDLAPLFKAWTLLDANFAPATTTGTTTPDQKLYGAIKGLASAYGDDYTVFFPPVEKQIFETQVQGDFSGVGMEIGKRNGYLTVIAPIKDTPAYRAGILSGDIILKIDGVAAMDLEVEEAVSKIRGKKGTQVTLTLSRADKDSGKEFDISVTRDTIELPTVDHERRADGIFVIRVYMFNGQAPRKFADAVYEFQKSGAQNLIIDLRGNPGGYLEAAVDMASWFLPAGDIVVTQDYAQNNDQVYRSAGSGSQFPNAKIVILLNGGSASASEIFAGALRDHGRATLIGQQSFGKGSVQQVFDVTKDTSLKITIARWLTPNGVSISHQGLTPDVPVEIPADIEPGDDPTLDRAVKYLLTGN